MVRRESRKPESELTQHEMDLAREEEIEGWLYAQGRRSSG